jgi:hypothetical protein
VGSLKFWRPSLRCDVCRKIAPLSAAKAWLMQPVGPTDGRGDGGRIHFLCQDCRALRTRNR